MSKNQLEKIEEFISSIENEEIGEKTQSFVISKDLSSVGGAYNSRCENTSTSGCAGSNFNCENSRYSCSATSNHGQCSNTQNPGN